ncbi:DUF4230 domain-containing protein [Baaleninema sp.]|uniref:DUF4230 domain-containing protein n=1 Tax=Baaleninema sp. TaxID=3101197 RepID=UPI003D00CF54
MTQNKSIAVSLAEKLLHPAVLSSIAVVSIAAFQAERITKQVTQALFPPAPPPVTEVKSLLVNRLEGKTELTTAEVALETIVKTSQERMLGHLYLGETAVVYQGIGRVRAGIDLSQVQVTQIDRNAGEITLLLPPPRLVQMDLDVDRSSVLEHQRIWFAPNTETQLYTQAQRQALKQIREEACQTGLLEKANQEAAAVVRSILEAARYQEITVNTQSLSPQTCMLSLATSPNAPSTP